jgi:hypothetical protein
MKSSFVKSYTMNLTQMFQSLGAALLYSTRRQRIKDTIWFHAQGEGVTKDRYWLERKGANLNGIIPSY